MQTSGSVFRLAGVLVLASVPVSLATAQTKPKTVWDGAYTEDQATRGAVSFGRSCGGCHAIVAGGKAPLVGEPFMKSFAQKNVSDLLDFISKYMPNGNAGTLSENTYDDIVAYVLKTNGFPAGMTEAGKTTSVDIEIIPRDGGTKLPNNALVHVVGCLTKSGADWTVTKATTPERAESAPAGGDATRALGTRTMPLKYLLTSPTALAGARVSVNGLLIGADGVGGINVTTIGKVADKCR